MYGLHVCMDYFTIMPLLLTVTISKTFRHSFLSLRGIFGIQLVIWWGQVDPILLMVAISLILFFD